MSTQDPKRKPTRPPIVVRDYSSPRNRPKPIVIIRPPGWKPGDPNDDARAANRSYNPWKPWQSYRQDLSIVHAFVGLTVLVGVCVLLGGIMTLYTVLTADR